MELLIIYTILSSLLSRRPSDFTPYTKVNKHFFLHEIEREI